MNRSSLLAGVGIGAVVAYLFDPDGGARRRGRLRDMLAHGSSLTRRASGRRAARDVLHHTYGSLFTMRRAIGMIAAAMRRRTRDVALRPITQLAPDIDDGRFLP